jgi:hypothetical protein
MTSMFNTRLNEALNRLQLEISVLKPAFAFDDIDTLSPRHLPSVPLTVKYKITQARELERQIRTRKFGLLHKLCPSYRNCNR